MQRFILALAIIAGILTGAYIASAAPIEPQKKQALPNGWKKLNLTKAQMESVYKHQEEFNPKIDAAKKAVITLQDDLHSKLLSVLTDAQKNMLIGINPPAATGKDTKKDGGQ